VRALPTRVNIELNQLNHRWTGVTLKLKIGKKGYVILPKSIRESVGIEEGDTVTVEVGDGITLKPTKKPDTPRLRKALREHAERLRTLKNATSPIPGELASTSLEEELEG
jgi:antitoxin PrlF